MVCGLNTCLRNVEPCPLFFCLCASCGISLCCFVIRAQIEERSQVALVSAEPVRELSFFSPSEKVLRSSHHSLSSSLMLCSYPGFSRRPRLVNSAGNKFVSAHSEQCESVSLVHFEECRILCLVHPRALRSTRLGFSCPPRTRVFWFIRALCEVRTSVDLSPRSLEAVRSRVRHIW